MFFRKNRTTFVPSLALFLPLLLISCPRENKKPDPGRVGVSERPAASITPAYFVPAFNGERAMDHVRKQVEIGPREPGSAGAAKTRAYIVNELKSHGLNVSTEEFVVKTPLGDKAMANITVEIAGESKDVIILASHYDTKYYKDMLFVGANDPGASVGTLIELARVLSGIDRKSKFTYRLVFFDGEEAFCEDWDECGQPDAPDNTYGSRHYVDQLKKNNQIDRIRALILLDLMGYKNLELGRDTLSTRWLQDIIWQSGRQLGHDKIFVNRPEEVGGDDHLPFLQAGIAAVDLIQLSSYPHWHKADDTIDKVSAQSMKIVGDVILASLPRIEQRLSTKR